MPSHRLPSDDFFICFLLLCLKAQDTPILQPSTDPATPSTLTSRKVVPRLRFINNRFHSYGRLIATTTCTHLAEPVACLFELSNKHPKNRRASKGLKMDRPASSNQYRDAERARRHLAQHARASSRASTNISNARTAAPSINTSSSRISSPPPRPASAALAPHRHHHGPYGKPPSTPRAQSVVPSTTQEAVAAQSAVSSFLQERLQRSREEAEKSVVARLRQDMASPMGGPSSPVLGSPARGGFVDGRHPGSTHGLEPSKPKGLGVKEMEAVRSAIPV